VKQATFRFVEVKD